MANKSDISENLMLTDYGETVCMNMLKDHTTKENIYWATDSYEHLDCESADRGESRFHFYDQLTLETITSFVNEEGKVISRQEFENLRETNQEEADTYREIIRPRSLKTKEEQTQRAKDKAEVFTPAWICNAQNNLIDEAWFGRKEGLFNYPDPEDPHKWINNEEKISFEGTGKDWKDYVSDMRLEITCGEAPYLCNRYDAVTGDYNENVKYRIGLLDRKLRIVSENVEKSGDWLVWAKVALRSIYGFEWQGDNLLLAREALFFTFLEHYEEKFNKRVPKNAINGIAYIVSWNLWQMDGLTFGLPGYKPREETKEQKVVELSFIDDPAFFSEPIEVIEERPILPQERYCKVKDFLEGIDLKKDGLDSKDFHDKNAPTHTFESLVNKEKKG